MSKLDKLLEGELDRLLELAGLKRFFGGAKPQPQSPGGTAKSFGVAFSYEGGKVANDEARFATAKEAQIYARVRAQRWDELDNYNVVPTNDPPNKVWNDGTAKPLTPSA